MARFGGMTALRAALGAVGGITEGLQQRELLAEKRKRDEEAAAMQQAQLYSSLGLRAQPYRPASEEQVGVTPASSMDREAFTAALQRGMDVEPPTRDGATTAFQRSVQRGMGVEPTQAGAALSPLQSAFQKATSGDLASSYTKRMAETQGMRQKLPGGMEVAWQAGPTDEEKRTARLADLRAEKDVELEYQDKTINTERERMRGVYRGAYPTATEQQINGMVNGIKAEDMGLEVITPSQKKAQARQESLDALNRQYTLAQIDKLKADAGSAQEKKRMTQQNMSTMLPTILGAAKDINSWGEKEIRQLSPTAIAVLNQASLQGELSGVLIATAASQMTNPIDRRYLQYAAAISDAVARASEVGVLTNQDVNRYRNQVLFVGGEEMGDKRFKVNNLKQWATWLATNKGMFSGEDVNRASLSLMPGETQEDAQQSRGWQPANRPGSRFEDRMRSGPVQQQPSGSVFGMPATQRIGMTLEQEFPEREAQIKAARDEGYTDAQIRTFFTRGR